MEFHWSDQLQYVKALVLETNQSVFITGKAGTGKL
jgi:DNA-binding NtrC family response regulator